MRWPRRGMRAASQTCPRLPTIRESASTRRPRADPRRWPVGRNDHRPAARRRRLRLRSALPRSRDGPHRRRVAAGKEERAFASRQGDPLARVTAGIDAMSAAIQAALGAPRFEALPPLALYIHIPWCLKKCPYCDFNSHERRGEVPEARYVAALMSDLESALPSIWGRRIVSVFLGGGTPSLFSPESIDTILAGVRRSEE